MMADSFKILNIPLSFEAVDDTSEDVPAVYIVWLAVVACDIGI